MADRAVALSGRTGLFAAALVAGLILAALVAVFMAADVAAGLGAADWAAVRFTVNPDGSVSNVNTLAKSIVQ